MSTYLRVDGNGVAVESWTAPDGKTPADCFVAALAATFVPATGGAALGWTWANGTWSAPVAAAPTQAQLATALIAAASSACDAITAQVETSETHVAGYQNVAAWVAAAGGVPTSSTYATAFANLATAMGTTAVNLAMLVEALSAASVNLLALVTTLGAGAAEATTATALGTALASFESGITAEVAGLNAALAAADLATEIVAPPTIAIPGINA